MLFRKIHIYILSLLSLSSFTGIIVSSETLNKLSYVKVKEGQLTEIAQKVISIISDKLGVAPEKVTRDASIYNHLGADSLDCIELIMEYEVTFKIAIPDSLIVEMTNVGKAIDYLEQNVKEYPPNN